MEAESLACLFFMAGATLCALPCERVARVTKGELVPPEDYLALGDFGLSTANVDNASRLLWLSSTGESRPLPIASACTLVTVDPSDIFPLPHLHRRLTPFVALLTAKRGTALLLDPALLVRPPSTKITLPSETP